MAPIDAIAIRSQIRAQVANIVGSDEGVQDDTPLMDIGLDSLSSVQFRNDLTRDFNIKLPASVMFDYPTISTLVTKVSEVMEASAPAAVTAPDAGQPKLAVGAASQEAFYGFQPTGPTGPIEDDEAEEVAEIEAQYKQGEDLEEALEDARDRRKELEREQNLRDAAETLEKIGHIHLILKEHEAAARAALAAKNLYRKESDMDGQIRTLKFTVLAYLQASRTWEQEAETQNTWGNDRESMMSKRLSREFADKAVKVADSIAALGKANSDSVTSGLGLWWKAKIQLYRGDSEGAMQTAGESESSYSKAKDDSGAGKALILCSKAYHKLGQGAFAAKLAEDAKKRFKKAGDKKGEADANALLNKLGSARVAGGGQALAMMAAATAPGAAAAASVAQAAAPKVDPVAIRAQIRAQIANIVGSEEGVQDDTPLMDIGLDSLSSVQFRNDLTRDFNVKLPSSIMFDYPTVNGLVDKVKESLENK